MARLEQFTCDVCGAIRQQSNHWFLCWKYDGVLHFDFWDDSIGLSLSYDVKHLCGLECATRKLNEHLMAGEKNAG